MDGKKNGNPINTEMNQSGKSRHEKQDNDAVEAKPGGAGESGDENDKKDAVETLEENLVKLKIDDTKSESKCTQAISQTSESTGNADEEQDFERYIDEGLAILQNGKRLFRRIYVKESLKIRRLLKSLFINENEIKHNSIIVVRPKDVQATSNSNSEQPVEVNGHLYFWVTLEDTAPAESLVLAELQNGPEEIIAQLLKLLKEEKKFDEAKQEKQEKERPPKAKRGEGRTPGVGLDDLAGIGPVHSRTLENMGFESAEQLINIRRTKMDGATFRETTRGILGTVDTMHIRDVILSIKIHIANRQRKAASNSGGKSGQTPCPHQQKISPAGSLERLKEEQDIYIHVFLELMDEDEPVLPAEGPERNAVKRFSALRQKWIIPSGAEVSDVAGIGQKYAKILKFNTFNTIDDLVAKFEDDEESFKSELKEMLKKSDTRNANKAVRDVEERITSSEKKQEKN